MRKHFALAAVLAAGTTQAPAAQLEWDALRGSVRAVTFGASEAPRYGGSAAEVARAFVAENAGLFNGAAALRADSSFGGTGEITIQTFSGARRGEPEVEIARVDEGERVSFVRMKQMYRGHEVAGADLVVAVRADGSVSAAQGGYVAAAHDLDAGTRISGSVLDDSEALAAARAALPAFVAGEHQKIDRVFWMDREGGLVSAFRVELEAAEPRADWQVFVDSASGRILETRDLMMSFAQGKGRVHMSNPLKTPELVDVVLTDLNAGGKLVGPFTKIMNGKADTITAADGNFVVDKSSTHFAEVMGFFHVNRIHAAVKTQEPSWKGMDWQVPLTVHDKGNFFMKNDNAFYSPMKKALFILDPKKLNDLHLEAEVVYHEYHHAVTDAIVPGLSSTEGRAMHEGYADYFACSISEDPEIGEWALQPIGKPNMRDLRSGRKYPQDLHPQREPHSDGEIWAASCWDLRAKLGATKADFLVHKSRFYISGNATFKSAYEGILAADKDFFGSANQADIKAVFDARGISGPTAGGEAEAVEVAQKARFSEIYSILD